MKQIQANRLVGVLNMLETLPKTAHFDINNWSNESGRETKPTLKAAMNCGTSACAVGWAILLIPAWKKHFNFKGASLSLTDKPNYELNLTEAYVAIGKFIGVSEQISEHLFAPGCYYMVHSDVTPDMVAERIENVLADNGYDLY